MTLLFSRNVYLEDKNGKNQRKVSEKDVDMYAMTLPFKLLQKSLVCLEAKFIS